MDIIKVQDDPSSFHALKCVDYARCPMPSQLTVPLDMLQKLNTYFKSNQRFKKDKLHRAIEVDILPQLDEDEVWERGWHVRVNAQEFCQQLLSIQYRVHSGDRFDQRQCNELCLMNLYRLFDWDTYKEDIANVIKIREEASQYVNEEVPSRVDIVPRSIFRSRQNDLHCPVKFSSIQPRV